MDEYFHEHIRTDHALSIAVAVEVVAVEVDEAQVIQELQRLEALQKLVIFLSEALQDPLDLQN